MESAIVLDVDRATLLRIIESGKAVRRVENKLGELARRAGTDTNGDLAAYAWPGGAQLYYLDQDNCVICPSCANKEVSDYRAAVLDPDYSMMQQYIYTRGLPVAVGSIESGECDFTQCEQCNAILQDYCGECDNCCGDGDGE